MSTLKDRMIREVEQTINRGNEKARQLEDELQAVWDEIEEARGMLHFLKTGSERPVREVKQVRVADDADPSSDRVATPEPKRRRVTRASEDDYKTAIMTFGSREFTSSMLAGKMEGISISAASSAIDRLCKAKYLVKTQDSVLTSGGRVGARYRVRRSA